MLTFRKKIFLSFFVLFLIAIGLMFPFASRSVRRIALNAMNDRASELIERIKTAGNNEGLIKNLKDQKSLIFFRVSLISNERKVIYDSHARRALGPQFDTEFIVQHPEVEQAFEKGIGYHEDYSKILNQTFAYVAKSFDFNGKPYVLRLAFPLKYVQDLTSAFEIGFFLLTTLVLLLFSLLTWFIVYNLTKPIQQIIDEITPFQEGKSKTVPTIHVHSGATEEFAKLASTLNALSAKIQGQINTLKDFIANASHELKTPITIVQGFAETLQDNPDLPKPIVGEITQKIVNSCKRMTNLIKDLFALTDIDQFSDSRLVRCDLQPILEHCVDMLKELYPGAHVEMRVEADSKIKADPSLMELAFMNLIQNAARYSKDPAEISILLKRDGRFLSVSVADKGIGIPKADLERVFERFYTVDKAHSQKMGGSGLGLSIVEMIVNKHKGTIEAASVVDKGSTFTVRLPLF